MKTTGLKVFILALALLSFPAFGMSQVSVRIYGTVSQAGDDTPVAFATVVAMHADSTVAAAAVAGGDGLFSLDIESGKYIFNVSCIGYAPVGHTVECSGSSMKVDFKIEQTSTVIEEVKVRAPKITRESDRFVINVAGTLDAIGKNAEEFLRTAPAVWIRNDKIMVDGRPGAQVIVNDRVLNMNDEQALAYLRSINAEDIARIEIIPRAGADYDASSSGGVIKITLRKKRDAGLEVSPAYRMSYGKRQHNINPSLTVNFRTGKFAFYAHGYNDHYKNYVKLEERNVSRNTVTESMSSVRGKSHNGGGRFGVIYDINDRQSVGVEYAGYSDNGFDKISPYTVISSTNIISTDSSSYKQGKKSRNHYVAANYIVRLDTLGSVFKVIGDVARTTTTGDNRFWNRKSYFEGADAGTSRDSLYRNDLHDKYIVATGSASLEQVLSSRSRLMAGMKFVYTSLDDDSRYFGNLPQGDWELDRKYSLEQRYTEKIAAAYAVFNSSVGPVKYSLGLRGEYTHATPVTSLFDDSPVEKNRNTYFSLFPNANVSWQYNDKGHSLTGFYARKINRPGYWALNPFRMQVSEYSYIIGDPMLKPTYIDEAGLSFTFFHKLSLTAGHRWIKDQVEQYVTTDHLDPNVIVYQQSNISSNRDVFVSVNLPVDIAEKISMNANLYYGHERMDPGTAGQKIIFNTASGYISFNFTLPHSYRIEVGGWYTNGQRWGNMLVKGMGDMNVGVRKRFFDDKLSVAVDVSNLLQIKSHQRFTVEEKDFSRRMRQEQTWDRRKVSLSLQYNFKTGKKANGRHVERGGDDSR